MKSLQHLFRRHPLAATLNLLGLALALAAAYLFATQVQYNRLYNRSIPNHERIYRFEFKGFTVESEWNAAICRPMERLAASLPQVESVQSINGWNQPHKVQVGENKFSITFTQLSADAPGFFGWTPLHGTTEGWADGHSLILTRSEALRLFGREDVAGESLVFPEWGGTSLIICAVLPDFPDNCTLKNGLFQSYAQTGLDNGSEWSYLIYLRLDRTESRDEVVRGLKTALMKENDMKEEDFAPKGPADLRLTPLADTYFTSLMPEDRGNRNLVGVLATASAFVLLVALLNLMNFSLSLAPQRIRGLNTRRVLGASMAGLRLGLVVENTLLALLSLALAAGAVQMFLLTPACTQLLRGDCSFAAHPALALATAGAGLLIGALSALYPAWYATSFAPALVLKGNYGLSPQGRRRSSAMLFVQFAVAIVLVIYILVMGRQSRYIFSADYGFNKEEVLYAQLPQQAMGKKQAVRQTLEQLPGVQRIAFGEHELGTGDMYMSWGRGQGEKMLQFYAVPVDENYLATLGIPLSEGRDFVPADSKGAYVINRSMAEKYPWLGVDKPISCGGSSWGMGDYPVVGVCENFKMTSMRTDNSTIYVAFIIMGEDFALWGDRLKKVFVRIAPGQDKVAAKQRLKQALQPFCGEDEATFEFLDDSLQRTYEEEFRFIAQVRAFAAVCILITLVGVFCLALFETEYRRKETALRRIMGSSVGQVVALQAGRHLLPLGLAFLVAAPLGYLLAQQWLQSFADHTPIHWWIFPLALLAVALTVLAIAAARAWAVATANPIESIRTE